MMVKTRALMPEVFNPVIDRLRTDAAAHFNVPRVRLMPVHYQDRPFSHLLRLGVCRNGDSDPTAHLFIKIFKANAENRDRMRNRVAGDYEATRRIYGAMQVWNDLGVVSPVACYPELLAIVTEQAAGSTLQDYLLTRARWRPGEKRLDELRATLSSVGRWLCAYQSIDRDASPTYQTVDDLRNYIDARLQRLTQFAVARFKEGDRTRVLMHIDHLGRSIDRTDLEQVAVHSDMSLGNILVSGNRVVVLDFAMAKRGTWLHDLARIYVQLELLAVKPQVTASVIRRLQQALLHGFDPTVTADRPLFRLLLLLHRINHLTTLSVRQAPLAARLYNRVVRRQHHLWLAAELDRGGDAYTRQ